MSKHIEFVPEKCVGCKMCELACTQFHDKFLSTGYARLRVDRKNVSDFKFSTCKQCEGEPACLKACPVHAISKRKDGTVVVDGEKCVGCGACERACPYHAIWVINKKAKKCDMCLECVKWCMHDAVKIDSSKWYSTGNKFKGGKG